MKLLFTTIISIISIIALAQVPQEISYQAVARQASGAVISNALIGVKFIIYQGTISSSTISYEETHNANTNQFGLFTLSIGGGSITIGAFNTINWATGPYFIETLIDPAGGTSYSSIGAQQLMSVPYALYAEKAGNSSPTPTININAPNSIATPTTGVYNISVPSYSAGTGISISSGIIANTATSITPTLVAGANMVVNPIGASNSYTVSSPNYSLSAPSSTSLLLSNGINNSTAIIPTQVLSLSGSTLTAGVPSNSVNLATLPSLWTIVSLTNIATTNSLSSVGIGTNSPTYKLTVVETNTNAAIYGINTNNLNTSVAGFFDGGIISKGRPTSLYSMQAQNNLGSPIFGVYNSSGNVGINVLNPNNRLHVNSSDPTATLFAENIIAVSTASLAHGIKAHASSTHTLAAALFAENLGTGSSIYAVKTVSTGIVGRFEIQNTLSGADAIFAQTIGTGSAIHAVCGPTVSGSSNVALNIENGHLKSTGTNVVFTSTVSTLQTYTVTGNDVAGKISVLTSTLTVIPLGQELISITFNKPFAPGVIPVIMLTPTSPNSSALQVYVSSPTNTGFRIKNNTASSINTTYSFNYFIIE